jgi:hypothetical protein
MMELISVALARSIWLFDLNDLNPQGKSIFPDAFSWLGEKYAFDSFPKSIGDKDPEKNGFLFKNGKFQSDENSILVNFSIYTDGLVAETWSSTESGDLLIEEILRSIATRYGLVLRPDMVRKKQYVNELIIRLEHSPKDLNEKISRFSELLSRLFTRHSLPPFEFSGMVFAPDTSATSYKPPGFMVERKQGVPFADNRYWSKAPFPTKDHLFALEELEKLLAS